LGRRDQKRAEIIEKLARHVVEAGLGDTGLRRLAAVAGTSDRMLLYYFENKDEILTAVLTRIASGLAESLGAILGTRPLAPARALEAIWATLKGDAFADQLRLWLDLSSRASRGDPVFGEAVAHIGEDWIAWLSGILDVPEADRAPLAVLMMAAVDGQVVLFPKDLSKGDAAIRELVRLLERGP
jgi:AcrR family transcriptional regulator